MTQLSLLNYKTSQDWGLQSFFNFYQKVNLFLLDLLRRPRYT